MSSGFAVPPVIGDREELEVRLLGGVQVRVNGEVREVLRPGRARSLLAFLIMNAEVPHARQRLAFEFWPDSSESQARTNLRNLLHTLRQAHPWVQSALHVTPTTLQWIRGPTMMIDVDVFAEAARATATSDPDHPDELIDRCRATLSLYGGELLVGDHDEWILVRRDALRDRYRGILRLLATALIDSGRAVEAIGVTRELVRADPVDESAHRLRIEAHHVAGDRAGAVRAYHDCVATLDRELGVEPSPATSAAYAVVVEHPTIAVATPGEPSARARADLVGRDDEWRQLVASWRAAETGRPRVVFVTGEAGIGKTRLVDELRLWCARSGATVAEAKSYASEGDLAYGVVVAWLRSPDIQLGMQQLPHGQRVDLARLLPEIGSPPPGDHLDDAERRRRIFDAAVAAICSQGKPTLLVADDVQWSDHASQEFIHYLVRQHLDAPLLVVLTARREEIDTDHRLTAVHDSLAALEIATEVSLDRLSREATGALAAKLSGSPLDDARADALFAETEGNPLFIVEIVLGGGNGGGGASALSPRLRAAIDARFHRLSDVAAVVLGAAAVAARPCSASLLGKLSDLDDRSLARGLDELWQRGILRETGLDCYEFSHGKLRDAAYENLSPVMRRSHHAAVAEALAQLACEELEVASSQVAVHYEAANRPDEAITWFQKAAIEAQQVAAYVEAVRLLDQALALVPSLPATVRHARELELLAIMPPALGGAEGYGTPRMHEAHQRAADVAGRLGVRLEPAVLRSMVMSALCRDEFADAADTAGRLLDHADASHDASLRVESHYLLGISAFWAAQLERARQHFEFVIMQFDPTTRARHHAIYGHDPQVVCQSRLANTLWFLGRHDDARAQCEAALALADEVGHALSRDTAGIFSFLLAIDMADYEALRRRVEQLGTLGLDTLPLVTKRDAIVGLLDALDGNVTKGIARIRGALDRCEGRNFYPCFQAAITRVLLAGHLVAGDAASGPETCRRLLTMGSTPLWDAEAHRARAELLHVRGAEPGQISAELATAEAVARRQQADGHLRNIERTRRGLGLTSSPAAP